MPVHWQPYHDLFFFFCWCERRRWEGWGWRRKWGGGVEGFNVWMEKFRGVWNREQWKGTVGWGEGGCELAAVEVGEICVCWVGLCGSGLEVCRVPQARKGVSQGGWQPQRRSGGLYFLPFFPPPSAGCSEEKARQKAEPVPRRSCSDLKMALCATLIFRSWAVLESSETCQEWE